MKTKLYIHFPYDLFPTINQQFTVTIRQVPVLLIQRPDAIRHISVNNTTSK